MPFARRHFRHRRGNVEASFEAGEALAIAGLCRDLSNLLDGATAGSDDPVLHRLFPRAYLDPTEEQAEADWQHFAHDDLVAGRHDALATVIRTMDLTGREAGRRLQLSLNEEEASAWLSVLNDARLALGTRLDVTEETDFAGLDPDDPDTAPYAIYWWLGMLQEELVAALSGA